MDEYFIEELSKYILIAVINKAAREKEPKSTQIEQSKPA
jgi:hypothetical protein